jgi:hypothetical protein
MVYANPGSPGVSKMVWIFSKTVEFVQHNGQ